MNAGGAPNTCKSNGDAPRNFFGKEAARLSGGRVSNAWATCHILGDNARKRALTPHTRAGAHAPARKTPAVYDGPASD